MLTMEMVLHKDVDFAPKFGKNPFTFKNTLHSLHGYRNSLNINASPCNEACFSMSLIALLVTSSDISDKAF